MMFNILFLAGDVADKADVIEIVDDAGHVPLHTCLNMLLGVSCCEVIGSGSLRASCLRIFDRTLSGSCWGGLLRRRPLPKWLLMKAAPCPRPRHRRASACARFGARGDRFHVRSRCVFGIRMPHLMWVPPGDMAEAEAEPKPKAMPRKKGDHACKAATPTT